MALGCLTASAQTEVKTEYVFQPHWYLQAQMGAQYTLGEISFKDLISPNIQIGAGYQFNKVVGARFTVNAWEAKAGQTMTHYAYAGNAAVAETSSRSKWKWNYVAPMVDATFDLTNLFCAYNPKRLVSVGVFAGMGVNVAFNNDDAINSPVADKLEYLWDGTKTRLAARAGANVEKVCYNTVATNDANGKRDGWENIHDRSLFGRIGLINSFRLSDRVSVGLECHATTLNDKFNSKRAGNADWQFTALAGVKIKLGKGHTTRTVVPAAPVERIVERIVEKPVRVVETVEKPVAKEAEVKAPEQLRRDIFFIINSNVISASEAKKVDEIVEYMNKYPNAKVTVTGYADKGTGNNVINDRVAAKRAQIVVNTLVKKGIAASRISSESKGSRVQPYAENNKNRVTICIAE